MEISHNITYSIQKMISQNFLKKGIQILQLLLQLLMFLLHYNLKRKIMDR
jgi:hypothetical protein